MRGPSTGCLSDNRLGIPECQTIRCGAAQELPPGHRWPGGGELRKFLAINLPHTIGERERTNNPSFRLRRLRPRQLVIRRRGGMPGDRIDRRDADLELPPGIKEVPLPGKEQLERTTVELAS